MRTREEIEQRYRNDLEAAESFRGVDDGRYNELVNAAKDRRYSALDELATQREAAAATAQIDATRARVATQYPLADPKLITGGTPEEIEASAKNLQDFAKRNRDEAEAAARAGSRAARAGAYRDGVPASAPQAGSSARGSDREAQEDAQAAKDRNDNVRRQSGLTGDQRDRALMGRTEEEVIGDIRKSGRMAGLSIEAFKARNEGTAVVVGGDMPDNLSAEDRRG